MTRGYARLRERNQLTLPAAVVEQIGLRRGDIVEFASSAEGFVELRPAKIVRAGTPEARLEEQAARQEIADGRYTLISNTEELGKHLERLRKGEHLSKPAIEAEHLTDSQRKDVEAVVQTTFLKLLSELLESRMRKDEESSAERRNVRSKAGESF
jgi:bifunctional DNA-binding transcriptional regulator/antitoxin component of YhaV-PrlF toxin-antitoxin module